MYRTLQSDKIVDTTYVLAQRVAERFPQSGLSKVAAELADASKDFSRVAAELGRPLPAWRVFSVVVTAAFMALILVAIYSLKPDARVGTLGDLAQGVESLINDIVFAGLAIWFMFSLEARIKRKRALDLIAQLRSLAHVIDMHQFTKDPDRLNRTYQSTPSSPRIELTPALLTRYLDYCSEMLAILGKLGALLVQDFDDTKTLSAVNDIEDLTSGLQRKIWQKIMIVDRVFDTRCHEPSPQSPGSSIA